MCFAGYGLEFGQPGNLDSRFSDHRDVEAEVLLRLGHLDQDGFLAAERSTPADALICSFKGFYREDRAGLDNDGLPDIQAADLLGNFETEANIVDVARFQSRSGD